MRLIFSPSIAWRRCSNVLEMKKPVSDYCARFKRQCLTGMRILILGHAMVGVLACNDAEREEAERQRMLEEEQTRIREERRLIEEKRLEDEVRLKEEARWKEEFRLLDEARLREEARLEAVRLEQERLEKEVREQKELAALRERVRAEAVGKKLDVLETIKGKEFRNVTISSVSAVGFSIQHESGTARIQFEDLPEAMRKEYLYDPEEKKKLMDSERKLQNAYEMQLSEAAQPLPQNQSGSQNSGTTRSGVDVEKRRILTANLSAYNQQIQQIESEIRGLKSDLSSDLRKDAVHRSNRQSGGISRAPQIREKLDDKNKQLADARRNAAAVASELNSM